MGKQPVGDGGTSGREEENGLGKDSRRVGVVIIAGVRVVLGLMRCARPRMDGPRERGASCSWRENRADVSLTHRPVGG